jgi:hypothetical protein
MNSFSLNGPISANASSDISVPNEMRTRPTQSPGAGRYLRTPERYGGQRSRLRHFAVALGGPVAAIERREKLRDRSGAGTLS